MIGAPYPFLSKDHVKESGTLLFTFLSVSDELIIPKAVAYVPIERDSSKYYNFGFGDLVIDPSTNEFTIDDKVESNNGDVKKVFYTVVSTLDVFFDLHPDSTVYIEGSTRQRMDVYQGLIRRHWKEIEPIYDVLGFRDDQLEPFNHRVQYEYVLISRKQPLDLELLLENI